MARTADVVEAIKEMILTGEIQAGDRLPTEKDLGARLGVSRGPLREGISALAAMGVLDTRQGDRDLRDKSRTWLADGAAEFRGRRPQ